MKKSLTLLLIFLLAVNIASAGETFILDFTKSPAYSVGLNEGDRVEFKLKDSLHTVLVKEALLGSADIAIFTDINNKDIGSKVPIYTKVNAKKFVKLDIEKDGEADLNVIYQNSNSSSVSILFQLPVGPNKDLEVLSESQFKKDNFLKNLLYLFVALVVIFGLIFLILKRKAKESVEAVKDQNKAE